MGALTRGHIPYFNTEEYTIDFIGERESAIDCE